MLICLLLTFTDNARAQSLANEADVHFTSGIEAYGKRRYRDALIHFMHSNRLSPNSSVATNIGHTYIALEKFAEAYSWYSNAVDLAGEGQAQNARRAMEDLESRIVLFDFVSEPEGATVYVDRTSLGAVATTPATIALTRGEHSFIFELEDHHTFEVDKATYDDLGSRNRIEATLEAIKGRLVVAGMDGVAVYSGAVEGEPMCVVPCDVEMPVGQHVLQLAKDGYRTQPALISVDEGAEVRVDANPELVVGSVKVDTVVGAALVTIDGEIAGYTPIVARAPIGTRTVIVEAEGYEAAVVDIEVTDGSTVDLGTLRLKPRQIVTLASRVAEDLFTAPSSVSVVTGREMEAFGYPTILEALRGVRGLTAINADLSSLIMMRGVGTASNRGTQLKVLMNGVPLTDQLAGRQYVYSRSQNVETIEINRGSGSVLYGSGALTGLVSLQTLGRTDETLARGSIGFFGSEARLNTLASSGTPDRGAWVSVGAVRGEGDAAVIPFSVPDGETDLVNQPIVIDDYSPWRGMQVEGRAWLGDAEVWAQFATDRVEVTSGAEGSTLINFAGDAVSNPSSLDQLTVSTNYRPELSEKVALDLNAHFRQVLTQTDAVGQRATSGVPIELKIAQESTARWLGGGIQFTLQPLEDLRIVTGSEIYRSIDLSLTQDSQIWLPDENRYSTFPASFSLRDAQSVYAGYAVADYQPVRFFKTSLGLRVDQWYDRAPQVNPRLVTMFFPTEADVVKLMVGRSFRAPVAFEQKYFVESISVPALDLGPEFGWSYELEYSHHFSEWTALGSVWAANYQNVIVSAVDPDAGGLRRYANVDGALQAAGVDVELQRSFFNDSMFSAWYSYQRSQGAGDPGSSPEHPNHLAALKIATPIARPGLNAALRVVYEGERPYRADSPQTGLVPAGVLMDFVLSGRDKNNSVGWRAGVYNALDVNFAAATLNSTASPVLPQTRGRTFMASLELTGRVRRDETNP